MFSPVGIKRFESEPAEDGSLFKAVALYVAYVGGLVFYARDNFPYFGVRIFSRDGSFEVPSDIARYE